MLGERSHPGKVIFGPNRKAIYPDKDKPIVIKPERRYKVAEKRLGGK